MIFFYFLFFIAFLSNAQNAEYSQEEKVKVIQEIILNKMQEDDDESLSDIKRDCTFSIEQILTAPIRITSPGLYCVRNDLQTTSVRLGASIVIDSDNVILDLNNKRMIGNANLIGVRVNAHNNVVIQNGTIQGFSTGILITSNGGLSQNVIVDNINLFQNTFGLTVSGGRNFLIKNTFCNRSNNNAFTFNITLNLIIRKCIASINGILTAGTGFGLTNMVNPQIIECIATNNPGNGFNLTSIRNGIVRKCVAESNGTNGFTTSGNAMQNRNCIFNKCVAEQNSAAGFVLTGNDHSVLECISNNNVNGFVVNGINHTILNSISKINSTNGFQFPSSGGGSSNCQVRNNTATGNATNGFTNAGTNNRFYSNYANNNGTNYGGSIPNVSTSPLPMTPINFTTNIAE